MPIIIDLDAGPGDAPVTGSYALPLAYLLRFGATEAVQMLGDEQQLLTEGLLRDALAIIDGSASTWHGTPTGDEMAAGLAAATRLNRALAMTTNMMDGYLRNVVKLPIPADDANAGVLEDCCLALTRAGLADDPDNATDRMDQVAKDWRAWLKDVSKGVVQLVGAQGEPPPSPTRVRSGQAASGYDWTRFGAM